MHKNIFELIPSDLSQEIFEVLFQSDVLKIERIISNGHCSTPDDWYDQDSHEWVILLKGEARLMFEAGRCITLKAGDYLNIPAHCKHRVDWTNPAQESIWLAIFY